MWLAFALGRRRAGSIGQFDEVSGRATDPGSIEGVVVPGLGVIGHHVVGLELKTPQAQDNGTECLTVLEVAVADFQTLLRSTQDMVDDGDGFQTEVVRGGYLQGNDLVGVGADVLARALAHLLLGARLSVTHPGCLGHAHKV